MMTLRREIRKREDEIRRLERRFASNQSGKMWYKEDSTDTTTTGSWQEKLTMDVFLPAGNYRLGWSFEGNSTLVTSQFRGQVRFLVDAVPVLPTLNLSDYVYHIGDISDYNSFSGFAIYPLPNKADVHLSVFFKREGGGTAHCRNARLSIEPMDVTIL